MTKEKTFIDSKKFEGSKYFSNLAQDIIEITADRLELKLRDFKKALESKIKWWTAPMGLLISTVATLHATDFKNVMGIKAQDWEALFRIGAISSLIWLVVSLIQFLKHRKKARLENLIKEIKKEKP